MRRKTERMLTEYEAANRRRGIARTWEGQPETPRASAPECPIHKRPLIQPVLPPYCPACRGSAGGSVQSRAQKAARRKAVKAPRPGRRKATRCPDCDSDG